MRKMREQFCFAFVLVLLCLLKISSSRRNIAVYGFKSEGKNEKAIALTFDDGPHQTLTPQLLDILKENGAKATFFVIGLKAQMHPDIIKRASMEGNEIANHVWNHPVLSKLSYSDVHDQMMRTAKVIQNATGQFPKVMRPPYGNTNPKLNEFLYQNTSQPPIIWSLDTQDWKRPGVDILISKTLPRVKGGDVILCHDIHYGTIQAMKILIKELISKGFRFLTVSEMIENAGLTFNS